MEGFFVGILGFFVYLGPIVPFGIVARWRPSAFRRRLFMATFAIQVLAFLPAILHAALGRELAHELLLVPALTGMFYLVTGLFYLGFVAFAEGARADGQGSSRWTFPPWARHVGWSVIVPPVLLIGGGLSHEWSYRPDISREALRRHEDIRRKIETLAKDCRLPEATQTTPPTPCCSFNDGLCRTSVDEWDGQIGWSIIGYRYLTPSSVQMKLDRTSNESVVVSAFGDIDCDGTFSTFQRLVTMKHESDDRCSLGVGQWVLDQESE